MLPSLLILFCIMNYQNVWSANILYIATMASPSHHIWNRELILGLVERGHNVTSLTHLSEPVPIKNWTIITIEGLYDQLPKLFDMKKATEATTLEMLMYIYRYPQVVCDYDLNSREFQTLLEYPKNAFDLIIYDTTLGQCMYPLVELFKYPPVVGVYLLPLLKSRSFGSHIYTSYMPYFTSGFSDEMCFTERVLNFVYMYTEYVYHRYIALPEEYKIAQEKFGENIRSFEEMEQSISIVLTNIDPNLDYPISLPPNVIPVGGLHTKPAQKLPENLQKIFDKSEHGVILVSFGTNVDTDLLDFSIKSAFNNAFGRLKQTVIWKYNVKKGEKFPDNVIPVKWLPQQDILGHPNLKLFISQCGGFSYQEAIYHGVPLVAIPFVIDQYTVAERLAKRKLAVKLNHKEITADKLYDAIIEVLNNPVYRENMKHASEKYRDQPQTPLERGLFWIEYVLRHGNADMVSIAKNLPMYQLANLDVFLFFIALFFLAYALFSFLFLCCKFLCNFVVQRIDK